MKKNIKLICIFAILISGLATGQVIIGSGKTQVTNASVSLEFGTEEKGIILPWVTSASIVAAPVNGTLIFDTTDKKTKVYQNNNWVDLTINTNGEVDTTLQDSRVEVANAKVSVGTPSSVPGILVLEDTNKAMVLPQVESYLNITTPAAGMMVFDTSQNLLCLFNGKQWTFWKASN